MTLDPELIRRFTDAGHAHVFAFADRLDAEGRARLAADLAAVDPPALADLFALRDRPPAALGAIAPIEVHPAVAADDEDRVADGEAALRRGEVAVLLVAGGQGSRLGFEHPKGMFPVGPVTGKTLFHFHAEKVRAARDRYGRALPLLVMTSRATHDETVAFFEQCGHFGLPPGEVHFFQQGLMPALDYATGRLLLEDHDRLFLSPDGHGGTLTALAKSGLLARMRGEGVRHFFYLQVDNPLVKIADPLFLGRHLHARAEASSKAVAKVSAAEKMGVLARVDGRCGIVEYSDLPEDMAKAVDDTGRLRLWAGNPAIHVFEAAFLDRMTREPQHLALHVAHKKVPHIDERGEAVDPSRENALKFERFIFDALPAAERSLVVEALRADEFAPLKNAEGADSPKTVARALTEQAAGWVEAAGGTVPRGPGGESLYALEVSPLYALDAEEFARKAGRIVVDGPRAFG